MRRKLREQILQCVRDSKLFDNAKLNIMAESFVGWMLDECEASGVLCNFSSKKYHPLSHIFNGSYNDYLVVLNKLCGTGFVEYDEQALRVRVCNVTYLYKLKAEIYHKRKYKRQDEIKEQQNIFESINSIRETILDKKSGMESIRNVIGRLLLSYSVFVTISTVFESSSQFTLTPKVSLINLSGTKVLSCLIKDIVSKYRVLPFLVAMDSPILRTKVSEPLVIVTFLSLPSQETSEPNCSEINLIGTWVLPF